MYDNPIRTSNGYVQKVSDEIHEVIPGKIPLGGGSGDVMQQRWAYQGVKTKGENNSTEWTQRPSDPDDSTTGTE